MADEKIRIEIAADDDASDVIDDVADAAEALEDLTPEVQVDADTDAATDGLDDVTDAADRVDDLDPELEVRADVDAATRGLDDVVDEAGKIDDLDPKLEVTADTTTAQTGLADLRTDLDTTGNKAAETDRQLEKLGGEGGLKTRGNAIADLTGPLGEASGAASDFAGVFDGLGDIGEDVAGKIGVSSAAMSSAIGGIGLAVAAAAALWTLFKGNQAAAAAEQKRLEDGQRKINEAIADGNREAAATEILDLYKDAYDAAKQAGIPVEDFTRYLTGQSEVLPGVAERLEAFNQATRDAARDGGAAQVEAQGLATEYQNLIGHLSGARDSYDKANGSIREQDDRLASVKGALDDAAGSTEDVTDKQERLERQADKTKDAFDRFRGALDIESTMLRFNDQMSTALTNASSGAGNTAEDIIDIKQSILDVAEYAGLTPIQVKSLLQKVDNGQLVEVAQAVQGYYNGAPAKVNTQLEPPSQWALSSFASLVGGAFGSGIAVPTRPVVSASGALYTGPR